MTVATGLLALSLTVLSACGSDDDGSDGGTATPSGTPSASAPPVETPSAPTPSAEALDLVGDWEIPSEDYVLHLKEDGSFVQDYQGVIDFRTGKWVVEGDTVTLLGDDGDSDEGTIDGDELTFVLGTATRM